MAKLVVQVAGGGAKPGLCRDALVELVNGRVERGAQDVLAAAAAQRGLAGPNLCAAAVRARRALADEKQHTEASGIEARNRSGGDDRGPQRHGCCERGSG